MVPVNRVNRSFGREDICRQQDRFKVKISEINKRSKKGPDRQRDSPQNYIRLNEMQILRM